MTKPHAVGPTVGTTTSASVNPKDLGAQATCLEASRHPVKTVAMALGEEVAHQTKIQSKCRLCSTDWLPPPLQPTVST